MVPLRDVSVSTLDTCARMGTHLQDFCEFLHHRGQFGGPLCFQARNFIGVAVALGNSFLDMSPPCAAPHDQFMVRSARGDLGAKIGFILSQRSAFIVGAIREAFESSHRIRQDYWSKNINVPPSPSPVMVSISLRRLATCFAARSTDTRCFFSIGSPG